MTSFELCDLPIVALENVLEKADPRELMLVSSLARYPVTRKVSGFRIKITQERAEISMKGFWRNWKPTDAVSEVLKKYAQLSKTFKGPLEFLDIDAGLVGQLENSSAIPSVCGELRLSSSEGNKHQTTVDSLLSRMRMDRFVFNMDDCEIRNEHIFSVDELEIKTALWMTPNDLLRCENKTLHIQKHVLTEEAINAFFMKWWKGDDNRLEIVLIDGMDNPTWDLSVIMAGMNVCEFDSDVRDRFYFRAGVTPFWINEQSTDWFETYDVQCGLDMKEAWDIRRADGTLASVEVDCYSNQIRFVVWKDARPSHFLLKGLYEEVGRLEDSINAKHNYMRSTDISAVEKNAISRDVQSLESSIRACNERIRTLFNHRYFR